MCDQESRCYLMAIVFNFHTWVSVDKHLVLNHLIFAVDKEKYICLHIYFLRTIHRSCVRLYFMDVYDWL